MSTKDEYRVYCVTEGDFIHTYATEKPTVCPNDPLHPIKASLFVKKGMQTLIEGSTMMVDTSNNISGIVQMNVCNIYASGNIVVDGTVDGRDINSDGLALDSHIADTNKHIDHSLVTINTSSGLSGGGTITSSMTISLNINGLTQDSTPDGASDYVLTYDTDASSHKKVLLNNLPAGTPTISYYSSTATIDTCTTSQSYVVVDLMTYTPPSGTYLVTFSASGFPDSANNLYNYIMFVDGIAQSHTNRRVFGSSGGQVNNTNIALHTQAIVTVNGSQVIDIRYKTTGGGCFQINERSLILLKLG